MFVQVVNPQNATCDNGQGGVCVSQLVGLIPDNQNVLNVFPDVNIVVAFGFQIFINPRETFNRGRYDRFFGTWISRTFAWLAHCSNSYYIYVSYDSAFVHSQTNCSFVNYVFLRHISLKICRHFSSQLKTVSHWHVLHTKFTEFLSI